MTTLWSKAATIGAGVLVLVMGAGVWRATTQAPEAPRAMAASAPRDEVAPATDAATAKEPETIPATTKGGAQAEFEALMTRLREKAKGATGDGSKQALMSEIIGELQKFIDAHPSDPVSDQARMAMGQLQIRMGQAAEAIITFRGVAEHPVDPEIKRPAEFMLAQSLALAGNMDLAKAKLVELSSLAQSGKTAQEKEVGKASKQLLAQLGRENAVRPGVKPPSFKGKDLAGQTHSPEQYRGKVVLIDFWATWCGPCLAELPAIKAVHEKYRDRGLVVLGVNLDEDRSAVKRFIETRDMSWPQIFDGKGWKNEIAQLYGVTAIPRAILVDREGVIRYASIRGKELDSAIAKLID
jgi:thiol-disulfide isomerase/thioredoxin